jgi:hypothetical protein
LKCQHGQCGGTIVFDPGDSQNPPRWKCHLCGREPKKEEKEMDQDRIQQIEKEKQDSLKKLKETKTKICKKYGPPHERPLGDFAKNAANPDGLERACKTCMQKYREELKKRKAEKNIKTNPKKKIKKIDAAPLPADTIRLEGELIRGIRRSLRKEFGEELIKLIKERFL